MKHRAARSSPAPQPLSLRPEQYAAIRTSLEREQRLAEALTAVMGPRLRQRTADGKAAGLYGLVEQDLIDMARELPVAIRSLAALHRYAVAIDTARRTATPRRAPAKAKTPRRRPQRPRAPHSPSRNHHKHGRGRTRIVR